MYISIDLYFLQIAIFEAGDTFQKPIILGIHSFNLQEVYLSKTNPPQGFAVWCEVQLPPDRGPIRQALLPGFFFWQKKRVVGLQQPPKNTDFQKRNIPSFPQNRGGCVLFFFGEKKRFFHDPTWELWISVQVDDRYGVAVVGAVPWVWASKILIKLRLIRQQKNLWLVEGYFSLKAPPW